MAAAASRGAGDLDSAQRTLSGMISMYGRGERVSANQRAAGRQAAASARAAFRAAGDRASARRVTNAARLTGAGSSLHSSSSV